MAKVTIYHNPRCGKSRQALQLIRDHGFEPEIIHYLETPPSAPQLDALCRAMGIQPLEMIRVKEPLFKELGLNKNDVRPRADWLRLMALNPKLIERPIVVHGNEVTIGRPPERVADIL